MSSVGVNSTMPEQERHLVPHIHRLITREYGENYWFNGCARYVMEALGEFQQEPDFGYWFFAGLTGDVLTQVFSYGDYMGECLSACRYQHEGGSYIRSIFAQCGYESAYISADQLKAHKALHLAALVDSIDRGIPVICIRQCWPPWCVYVGYEDDGRQLLLLTDHFSQPQRLSADAAMEGGMDAGWVMIGKKTRAIALAEAYRNAIAAIPQLFSIRNEKFCCGAEAFYAWAARIEGGAFEQMDEETFRPWEMYVSNICNMATNGCCAAQFLRRARALNPQLSFVDHIIRLYERTAQLWERDGGKDLEALGAGFHISLALLRDQQARKPIVERLREAGDCMQQVQQTILRHLK